jgi:trans-aconitate 2-methyltransferase
VIDTWDPTQYRRFQAERDQPFVDLLGLLAPVARRHAPQVEGIRFELDDIGTWAAPRGFDVIVANASLQWVPDHPAVLARWVGSLAGGGQLLVQVPNNDDHASHRLVSEVAAEMGLDVPPDPVAANVLTPLDYAELLDRLGAEQQSVRLQVYAHRLPSTPEVVEWVKGTTLTRVKRVADEPTFEQFVARYRQRLIEVVGDRAPYTYLFKRILFWARFR